MNRKTLGGLIVLNAALIAVLTLLSFTPNPAQAQFGGPRPGDYVMVAGETQGRTEDTIYITDLNNSSMLALLFDVGRRQLTPIGYRDLSRDATTPQGR